MNRRKRQNELKQFLYQNGKSSSSSRKGISTYSPVDAFFKPGTKRLYKDEKAEFPLETYATILKDKEAQEAQITTVNILKYLFLAGFIFNFLSGLTMLILSLALRRVDRYLVPLISDFYDGDLGTFSIQYFTITCVNVGALAASAVLITFAFYLIQFVLLQLAQSKIDPNVTPVSTADPKKLQEIAFYDDLRDNGVNVIRFAQFVITFGLSIWVVAHVVGVSNVFVIILLWVASAALAFAWLIAEFWNRRSWVIAYYCEKKAEDPLCKFPDVSDDAEGKIYHYKILFVLLGFGLIILATITTYFSAAANSNSAALPIVVWIIFFIFLALRLALVGPILVRVLTANRYNFTYFHYEIWINVIDTVTLNLIGWIIIGYGISDSVNRYLGAGTC